MSKEKIEMHPGTTVNGFRAPGYSIDQEGCKMLAQCGYADDSSAMLNRRFARQLEQPFEALVRGRITGADWSIREIALPYNALAPLPFSPSYAILLGQWYFQINLALFRRTSLPFILLFHLIDFADPLPKNSLPGLKIKIFTLSNKEGARKVDLCQAMLNKVRKHYQLETTAGILAA